MTALPAAWTVRPLGEVAETRLGKMLDKGKAAGRATMPYLRNANVQWGRIDLNDVLSMEVSANERERYSLKRGDLLVCEGGEIGRCAMWTGDDGIMAYQKALHRVRCGPEVEIDYLRHLLDHYNRNGTLLRSSTGSTIRHLPQEALRRLPVPLPPIEEQRRIVDLLEDHLSRLDAATSLLEQNRKRLQRLRLAAASKGLFGKHDWPLLALADLLEVSIGGVWGSAPGEDDRDVRVLRVTEMQRDGRLDPSTAVVRSVNTRQLASRQLRAGDLLLEKSGGGPTTPVGRVGLVPDLQDDSICSNFMQLLRPQVDRVDPRFLHLYLETFYLHGGTEPMQKASTNIRNLKASEYVTMPVPLPDMGTQLRLVAENEVLVSGVRRLDGAASAAARRGLALRRALLQAAFTGRLTGRSIDTEIPEELAAVGGAG